METNFKRDKKGREIKQLRVKKKKQFLNQKQLCPSNCFHKSY